MSRINEERLQTLNQPVPDQPPKKIGHGYIATAIAQYFFEIGTSNGITLYANNTVQYVKIVDVPAGKYGLVVKIEGTIECLLDATFNNMHEAVWDAVRIASNHLTDQPAEIKHRFNVCKLEHLSYDKEECIVLWKGEEANLYAIVAELCTKLEDGL